MAVNLPLANQDPYLANLDAPPVSTAQTPLDTGAPNSAPLSGDIPISAQPPQAGLSGDTYQPTQPAAGDSAALPFTPQGTPQGFAGWGDQTTAPTATTPLPSGPAGFAGWAQPAPSSAMPQAQAPLPTGPPPSTFGNDFAGSVLSAERNLPGGTNTQAFVHGLQSQAGGLTGGFIGGALAGAAIGSFMPVVGNVIGGLVGGLIGYYIGQAAQDELGKQLATQQTLDALKVQTDYEQNHAPEWYAVGQFAPALLAFHPNPKALAQAFQLIGKSSRTIAAGDLVGFKNLYWANKQNAPAMNALMMMAFGGGQTYMQYQQQVAAGDVHPIVLAINLIGMGLLSEPNYKWLGKVAPELRAGVQEAVASAHTEIATGLYEVPPGSPPEIAALYKARGDAYLEGSRLGVTTPEGAAKLEEVAHINDQINAAEGKAAAPETPGDVTPEAPATPQAPDEMVHPPQPDRQPLSIIPPTENAPGLPERMAGFARMADTPEKLTELVKQNLLSPDEADRVASLNGFENWERLGSSEVPAQAPEATQTPMRLPDEVRQEGEKVIPGVDRALSPVEAKTKADLAMIREGNKEFPPEPTKETTPGGISNRIREAVTQSPAADAAFQALSPYGEVHVVGGAVRNMIAGKPVKDLDMTFSGTEDQLSEALSKIGDAQIQKTGDRFPVYRLNVDGDQVEIALHRTENPENQNSFATGANIPIHEDLGRRDFTTNAMGVNIRTGVFQDPFNGLKHTQSKSLSLVNPKAFAGDPVRMLRALRFIGDGYHANKSLLESMKDHAALLNDIPPERIQAELDRIFSSEKPGKALEAMKESGVLDHIFPEHLKTVGFDQRSTHHNQLLWEHIVGVVNKVSELNPDPDVRMAAFLHDISKPDSMQPRPNGKMSYLGHEDKGAVTAKRILTGLKYSNDRVAKIEFLVKNHMFQQPHVMAHPAGFIHDMSKDLMGVAVEDRQAIVDQRIQDLFDIREADQSNHPVNKADIKGMREALDSIGQKPIGRPANNIDGNDLIDLGLKPGPEFSKILKQLDNEVLYDKLPNEPGTLLNRAKEIAGIKATTLAARRMVPHEEDPWPAVRRAILEHGGIGPSKDWPRDFIPGDLYRQDGKAPDLVATEATIGRADTPPWGDSKSDSDMMTYLRNAWEQHVKFQQQKGAFSPGTAVPMADSGHVNRIGQAAPRGRGVRESNPEVRSIAMAYTDSEGLPPPVETPPVVLNKEKAARLAKFYERAKSDPGNPEVQAAYHAFNAETQRQWELATQAGYTFEPWEAQGQPYKNSAEMRADILNNKHLFYFRTEEGQPPHELMTPDQNDKFRAVHDFFGHAMNGNEFGPTGEENAWAEHSKMYSPLAQKAMTTETRAQNSTVNFGTNGEHNRANPDKTIYADQKALIPPREFLPGQQMQLTHWSAKPRKEISPDHQGESGLSSELSRTGPNENKDARFASYYEEGQPHERFFGPGTAHPVKHTITGDYKILDLNSPEATRLRAETAGKNKYGISVAHEFDIAAKAAGYDGYKNRGTVRLFGKQPVSHINDIPVGPQDGQTEFTARLGQGQALQAKRGLNGLQQETTGQRQAPGQTGIGGETGLGTEASNAGQVGGEDINAFVPEETNNASDFGALNEPTQGATANDIGGGIEGGIGGTESNTLPSSNTGAGALRPDAGDEARTAGATIHAPNGRDATGRPISGTADTTGSDFSALAYGSRNRTATERGSTNAEQSAKDGSSGWTASSDVEEKFIQDVHDIASRMGVDMTKAPQFMGRVRMSPDEHGELLLFSQKPNDRSNKGNHPLQKAALFVPDDPRLVPHAANSTDWATLMTTNKLVDMIRLHENGNPSLEYLPAKITDDATRVALILKGWDNRFFYDKARMFPDSTAISFDGFEPGAKAKWAASQPVFGDGTSVVINARNVIAHFSRMEQGVFKNHQTGEQFDPKIFQDLLDAGLLKQYGHHGISVANLVGAAKGFLARTLKIGDYAAAMNNEARAPVDMWRARLAFGKDNTATTKMYDYEFGRNNFLTRMFAPFDHLGVDGNPTPIMPHHIQSAEWFGYQQHVSENLARIKQAALATGDPALIKMSKGIRANLESKDLTEVFRDYHGFTDKTKAPMLEFDKILAAHRDALLKISSLYTRRYLKGEIGAKTRKGTFKDVLDIQEKAGSTHDPVGSALMDDLKLRKQLADYYRRYFVNSKTLKAGPGAARQSLDRNIGPIAEKIASIAHAYEYPTEAAKLGKHALDLMDLARVPRDQMAANLNRMVVGHGASRRLDWHQMTDLSDSLVKPLAELHEMAGLPKGMMSVSVTYDYHGGFFARFDPEHPNEIEVNSPLFTYMSHVRGQLAPYLERELMRPDAKDLKGEALAKVKRVIAGYRSGNEESTAKLLLGHELAHGIQDRIYGPEILNFSERAPDHMVLPAAVTLLEHMTPKYMVGLVREGLGNQMEALLRAHSSSINEYLGGIKDADVQGEVMPLRDAVIDILEHQAHQWVQFMKLPHAEYSWATPETFRRNVYEPEIAEANYRELGKIYEKGIKALNDSLAIEAESQRSGRGPNPAIDSTILSPYEAEAGIAAYAKLPEGDSLQSRTSGWADPGAADKEVAQRLTSGERALNIKATADALRARLQEDATLGRPRAGQDTATLRTLEAEVERLNAPPAPVRPWPVADPRLATNDDPWLQKATAQAVARIQRAPDEGDKAFASRIVKASGAYANVDHALAVANSARDGAWVPVQFGDKIGFKVEGRFYKGTPGDHVANWADGFHDAIHTVVDNLSDRMFADEPTPKSIGNIRPADMSAAFADEYKPVASNAREGAVTITNKMGEDVPVPSLAAHHFLYARNADRPSGILPAGAAANKVTAHFEHVQESLDLSESLSDRGLFDPQAEDFVATGGEDVLGEFERLADAGEGLPPVKPPREGPANNGEEPPIGGGGRKPKGQSPEERKDALKKAQIANSSLVLRGYVQSLRESLKILDPAHLRVTSGINDLTAHMLKTFGTSEWYKDSRTWVIDASNNMRALAKAYQDVGKDISDRIAVLEARSPGASGRIREVQYAKQDARQGLLNKMSDEEAALADHLHHYWNIVGDTLMRAGITKTAIENYFPLMVEKPGGYDVTSSRGYSQKTDHAIARLKNDDGSFRHETPEDLQAYADTLVDESGNSLGWKVRTDVGDVFMRQGMGVTRALTTKHAIDQLAKNSEVKVGRKGELAPPILSNSRFRENPITSDPLNRGQYVKGATLKGPWRSALTYMNRVGDRPVVEDYWVHKSLAEVMERDTGSRPSRDLSNDMPEPGQSLGDRYRAAWSEENPLDRVGKTIGVTNQLWKVWQFFMTPMHEFSLLGNLTAHAGLNPFGVARFLTKGHSIVNDPAFRSRFYELIRAGAPNDAPELTGFQAKIPGYKAYHDIIWKKTMYNGTFGLADKLAERDLVAWAAAHPGEEITPQIRANSDKIGMEAAKKAMGSMNNMDMSKNWSMWGNVIFLANRWTTGQLRSVEESLGSVNGPFNKLSGTVPIQGKSVRGAPDRQTEWMHQRSIATSRQLLLGGMIRLAIVGTAVSTAASWAITGNVSTPFDNYQKDAGRTFDIYAGRDAVTGKDKWYRMPFYLFQREMVDWVLSAVKANNEGKQLVDVNNLGDSVLAAPFVKFAGKLDPITKLGLETATGTELAGWMKGFSNSQIDSDQYILNLNKSLQMLGVPDGGSLENRLLNGIRQVSPSLSFPTNLQAPTSDISQIIGALGLGLGPLAVPDSTKDSGAAIAPFLGSSQMSGTKFSIGPDGKVQPAWQIQQYYDKQSQLGQQILQIASTLGTGTLPEEKQKLIQMEDLRQQANFSPGQLTYLILHGTTEPVPGDAKGILASHPTSTSQGEAIPPVTLSGVELNAEQQKAYYSVTFQRQSQAILEAMSDPNWKNLDRTEAAAQVAALKTFADKITNQQFEIALGIKHGNVVNETQANSMLAEFGMIKSLTQNGLTQSSIYAAAKPPDQQTMLADRLAASQNAVWEKYYGQTTVMKGASDSTLAGYVALQGGLRDETRMLVEKLPSYSQSNDIYAQQQQMRMALSFADNLVNQAIQGKTIKTFDAPLTQQQLVVAVRNGVVLQDAALKQLHSSFIYQEAPQADQLLLDSKYANLAHNVALYDTRMGIQEGAFGNNTGFNSVLSTTLAADEGYQTLIEQFFGTGGRVVLQQREAELADLKARFKQEYNVAPNQLGHYNAIINAWYKQQNADYAGFLYYRTQWEKYDPLGQAYRATIQSNLGFEQSNPLALPVS